MKRILFAVVVLLFTALPAVAASAEKTEGRCTIEGSATFSPTNLKPLPTSELGYDFEGAVKCETLPTREARTGTVTLKGAETLSCSGAIGEVEGSGTLTLEGVEFRFGLTFLPGGPGSTELVVKFADGGIAVGSATFLTSSRERPEECFALRGTHSLEFTAAAIGQL
jgi:hypothetical protein